jgi:hypothetical protein
MRTPPKAAPPCRTTSADDESAFRAAINVLRDTIESRRMPSGLPLEPDAAALHERAAQHLDHSCGSSPPSRGRSDARSTPHRCPTRRAHGGCRQRRHDRPTARRASSRRARRAGRRLYGAGTDPNEGDAAGWRYIEFFTANINNPHTRRAYVQACARFFVWCEQRGLTLTSIRPFDVAAWCQFPEMCRLGDQRKDFPLTRRLPRQVTRRILRCLQAFPVECPRAKLDLLARLSARTRNESPHYGKCLLIKAEAISLKLLQESGPTSLRISGN